ncbi:hypothetical protein [Rubrivivax gelatinosus]|uniref:hypothetical protein n=1 Tax=Rubrivivax gelatinosus TaxID=28068 RepID=UPI0009D92229|nr:hypothetical protein [Rubrivivax gelatinosus]MBG6079829.1 hypothetical protein [Rubrivivax gelatinosus]
MVEKRWLDYLTAVGSVATPIFVLILTAVGWKLRQSVERERELEDKLREDRINTYNLILEPFIILFMTDAAWAMDKANRGKDKGEIATAKMLSLEYRKYAFKLSLVGSDAVVIAYNDLMQFFYSHGEIAAPTEEILKKVMSLLGAFLLEIRRSMGNETTKLSNWQMLEWFMQDARKWRAA